MKISDQTIGQAAEQETEGEDIDQTIGQAAEQETEGEDIDRIEINQLRNPLEIKS